MRTIEEYMKLPYGMELLPDTEEGGFVVSFPDLPGCLTVGGTIEEAYKNAEDAKREWILAAMEMGITIPKPDSAKDYSGQFKLRLPRSLHRQLVQQSKREGISMNQYCVYLLSQNNAIRRV
jgi:antitoxin HicB